MLSRILFGSLMLLHAASLARLKCHGVKAAIRPNGAITTERLFALVKLAAWLRGLSP